LTRHTTLFILLLLRLPPPPRSPLFPYTTLFRSTPAPARCCGATSRGISSRSTSRTAPGPKAGWARSPCDPTARVAAWGRPSSARSEEHTSELQSRENLVCRLLLEKKKKNKKATT